MTRQIVILSESEESFSVHVVCHARPGARQRRKHIVSINHDEDGWEGMMRVRDTVEALGRALGVPVVTR